MGTLYYILPHNVIKESSTGLQTCQVLFVTFLLTNLLQIFNAWTLPFIPGLHYDCQQMCINNSYLPGFMLPSLAANINKEVS